MMVKKELTLENLSERKIWPILVILAEVRIVYELFPSVGAYKTDVFHDYICCYYGNSVDGLVIEIHCVYLLPISFKWVTPAT